MEESARGTTVFEIGNAAKRKHRLKVAASAAAIAFMVLLQQGFAGSDPQGKGKTQINAPQDSSSSQWSSLLERKPYPYQPLPPEERTILDGTYTKIDPKKQPQVPCRRCPDYAPQGGLWKLQFDKGIFRIYHAVSNWKSIGSYQVEGNRLSFFNDPVCHEITGVYAWTLQDNQLILEMIEDECAIHLRAKNLSNQPWHSCKPPNTEAAITGHWLEPPGCR
jgi:hypothetical protein